MLHAFTRNYEDNSTEAGFQFTFYCDSCQNGFKSSFIESTTYKKGERLRGIGRGINAVSGMLGGLGNGLGGNIGWAAERGGDILGEKFTGMSPEWQKEHEAAFREAQEEVRPRFTKCPSCQTWVCPDCFNENDGLCVVCAPRQEVFVAKARNEAMQRNINEAAESATVWSGKLEHKVTTCPQCGKPAGDGKFCSECGAPMGMKTCAQCGAQAQPSAKFCGECGGPL